MLLMLVIITILLIILLIITIISIINWMTVLIWDLYNRETVKAMLSQLMTFQ